MHIGNRRNNNFYVKIRPAVADSKYMFPHIFKGVMLYFLSITSESDDCRTVFLKKGKKMGRKASEKIKNWCIFALPGCFIFCAVVMIPFFYGFYLTFTDWDGVSQTKQMVQAANYISVFKDMEFWSSMGLTLRYVILSVLLVNIVAFLLAYALTNGLKGQNFFRAGFFTPNLIGGVILGFIWQFVFSRVLVNLGTKLNWEFFSTSWLADPDKAFWALVIVTVWQLSGYMMLIYIAGFSGMSADVLEAASIDGATGFQKMKSIIFPLMVPSFVICTFFTLSRAFMVYDVNLTLTGGEPFGSTRLVAMYVYNKAFTSRNYGVGQAEALILFLIVAVISGVQIYLGKKKEVEA